MNFKTKILSIAFAFVFLAGLATIDVSAQTRTIRRVQRPVIVRQYVYVRPNPFWYYDYWDRAYFYDPYLEARRQRYYLERELRGNQEELRKHLQKYNADGVITAKEREELADDYRDVERAKRNLQRFYRRY